MMRLNRIVNFGYKIIKKTSGKEGKPLPNMQQYYLADNNNNYLSFWNDLPFDLQGDTITSCIEVPKQISNKYQVIKHQLYHPFMQDTKKNVFSKQEELRYYAQFPLFNYGFIPRTWEQNITKDSLGLYGDDDPIDVCDLSRTPKSVGSIFKTKILGCFCLIDQDEVDWKILTVDAQEARRQNIDTLQDYPKEQISAVMQWFKTIKVFDGKKANTIAYNQKIFTKDQTLGIIHQTHQEWLKLVNSQQEGYRKTREKYNFGQIKM